MQSDPGSAVRVVLMSVPDPQTGERLVEALVRERHAACGSVLSGARSVYWWKGVLERSEEALVVLKTVQGAVEKLLARAAELHPYEIPELLVVPVGAGYVPYLDWVRAEVRSD